MNGENLTDEALDEALKINKLLQDPKVQADLHSSEDEDESR